MKRLVLAALFALTFQACRDLSIPPPASPSNVGQILGACGGLTVKDYITGHPGASSLDDVAGITCKIDEKLDDVSFLTSTAATVCAHALGAYGLPPPQTVSAARTDITGQATCTQSTSQCGYAFFIKQKDRRSTDLELLGAAGCSTPSDSARGVLFACCVLPGAVPSPITVNPPTTTTTTTPK